MANIIEGSPTKQFFIDMITRDISIEDAIMDLIDNSIDGANRMRPDGNYEGLQITMKVNNESFTIEDNCGGFSLETAQKYAFRFGRPQNAPLEENNSVGRFGIGMKRSLFKMGKHFVVESQYNNDHFKVDVDVDEWSSRTKILKDSEGVDQTYDDWDFQCENVIGDAMPSDGTKILITNLNNEVKYLFDNQDFVDNIRKTVSRILYFSIAKGISISINEQTIIGKEIELLMSDDVRPYYEEGDRDGVHYRLIAGLGKVGEPKLSGWYIFCNDRLVVEADQTTLTGWGTGGIRQWHDEHVMFRGILFLYASETIKLPLTTTKKGIDATSTLYQVMLVKMRNAMLQIIPFLSSITKLKGDANDYRLSLVESLERKEISYFKSYDFADYTQKKFVAPIISTRTWNKQFKTTRISYDADTLLVEKAKSVSGVHSNKDIGLLTFNTYIKMQGISNEERK